MIPGSCKASTHPCKARHAGRRPDRRLADRVAGRVLGERESGERVIAGVFNRFIVPSVPATLDRFDVFVPLTKLGPHVDLRLRVERAESSEVVAELGGPMAAENPLNVVERGVRGKGFPIHAGGEYWLQRLSREEIIVPTPIHVEIKESPDGECNRRSCCIDLEEPRTKPRQRGTVEINGQVCGRSPIALRSSRLNDAMRRATSSGSDNG